jgi:hypothetical protein
MLENVEHAKPFSSNLPGFELQEVDINLLGASPGDRDRLWKEKLPSSVIRHCVATASGQRAKDKLLDVINS